MKRKLVLSINADNKTYKGVNLGYLTGILYLAPSDISGYQICPLAKKAGCEKACLYTAGRGAFNSTQKARINKTKRLFEDRIEFLNDLVYSIKSVVRKAEKKGLTPLIRLNGTSDLLWEKIPVTLNGIEYDSVMNAFPNVQFYDYTKIPNRKNIPSNYDLTFSYSGVKGFEKYNKMASVNPFLSRIAVVFLKADNIPSTFLNREVINGDNSDVRHIDAKNSVIGLYAKGKAKKENNGFVVIN